MLAANGQCVEVSVVGDKCNQVCREVILLKGCVVRVWKVKWYATNRTLQFTKSTWLQAAPEDSEEFGDTSFPLTSATAVPTVQRWSRCSIEGFVISVGDVEAGDGRLQGRWRREITVANSYGHGLRVKIRINDAYVTEFLEGGRHVQINFAQVMGNSLFCDVDDISEIVATGMDSTTTQHPNSVTEVCWPQQ